MLAELAFASPLGALIALAGLFPLAGLLLARGRARRVRRRLGLCEPGARSRLLPVAGVAGAAALLGAAAAQPVVAHSGRQLSRTDAEAYIVIDTSRSMLASRGRSGRARLDRAKAAAAAIRDALPTVPVGLASMTDRVLPHLFPSVDGKVFKTTLERAIGIERPPPSAGFLTNVTRLDAIGEVMHYTFFSDLSTKRLLVVITDAESLPVSTAKVVRDLAGPPRVQTVFVHVWDPRERVYTRGLEEPQYRPDRTSAATLRSLAAATGGSAFTEREVGDAAAAARVAAGQGPSVAHGTRRTQLALAPWLALGAVLPIALLLWRRDR